MVIFDRLMTALRGEKSEPRLSHDPSRLREGDVFLVSYPRSGNTWVRNIIAHLRWGGDKIQSLKDLDHLVPDVHRGLPRRDKHSLVIKSHNPFAHRRYREEFGYNRVIYLARSPFEVVRSYHHYLLTVNPRRRVESLRTFVDQFTSGSIWPGSWQEHVLSWNGVMKDKESLLVKYEDLQEDPTYQINRISSFLGYNLSAEEASQISDQCSRENMVELEREGSLVQKDYEFIRRSAGQRQAKRNLTDEQYSDIAQKTKRALDTLGYSSNRFER